MRVPHIVRPNKSGAAPTSWIVIHTEALQEPLTDTKFRHTFAGAAAVYWRPVRVSKCEHEEWATFIDADDLVNWVAQKVAAKERVAVIMHNASYQMLVCDLHGRLAKLGWENTRSVLDEGRFVMRWRNRSRTGKRGSKSLLILDITNFYPVGLNELVRWCAPDLVADMARAREGVGAFDMCEVAAAVVLTALRRWLEFRVSNDLGYFAPTIAGQAFNAYRHKYMHVSIYVHAHDDVLAVEREAYYGGRVDAFYVGHAPADSYYQVDVNAMYPSVMVNNVFPCRQVFHWYGSSPSRLADVMHKYAVVARVTVETSEPAFPKRITNSLVYPIGRFTTTLATPELVYAVQQHALRGVAEVIGYDQADLFSDYIAAMWALRARAEADGDLYTARLCKLLSNTLFGKFGQRIWHTAHVGTWPARDDEMWTELDLDDGQWKEYRSIGGRIDVGVRELPARDTLVAIPAHVTSYARLVLLRLINKAGWRHVYYCDTDSLIVDRHGYSNLGEPQQSRVLGGLRLADYGTTLAIAGRKWYRLDSKSVHSGVRSTARAVAPNLYSQYEYRSLEWSLRNDNPHEAIVERVEIHGPPPGDNLEPGSGGWAAPRVFDSE